ncbi:hypothetical protein [Mesonia aquimarina]|uniref:hypothetical protein n=1 Tax=Mesonia aquimarina TaxID=1504967 RepID=UPI0013CEEFF5|nr:hypothetical protein [Mesonia aquimarina]
MGKITLGFFLILFFGCKNFETKRVCSEEILQDELKQIDWNAIETYPTFANCEKYTESEQQDCFEQTFSKHIYAFLATKKVVLSDSINEKIWLHLSINSEGKPSLDSVHLSQTLVDNLPKFKTWLDSSVISLPKIYPARKRGIPVATNFKLPLRIESE